MKRLLFLGLLLSICLPRLGTAQSNKDLPFSWDNVTVYFLITDRFYNGDKTNDNSFFRKQDSRNNELDFHGGDIPGVTQKLKEGYFDELGVSAIWVTPVVENRHGFNNPPADDPSFRDYPYHGYHTNDWTAFDPNFTSAEQFEEFITEAHNHGIRVLVDIVMNHSGYRTFRNENGRLEFVDEDYPRDWVRLKCQKDGQPSNELPCDDLSTPLYGLPDIRTESFNEVQLPQWLLNKWDAEGRKQVELQELEDFFNRTRKPRTPRNYLIKWLTDWVREYGIDGFRVDTQRHVGLDAWADLKAEADIALREWKQNNPDKKLDDLNFYMTGEDSGLNIKGNVNDPRPDDFSVGKYNSMINFRSPKEAYTEMGQEAIFSSFAAKLNADGGFDTSDEYNMISYLRSHDFSEYYTGNMFEGAVKLLLSPGGVQIYYGDESGRQFFEAQTYVDAGYRSDMNWDSMNEAMLAHWRKLGKFRREHTSIGAGSHQKLSDSPYIFKREYNRNGENDKALVFQGQDGDFAGDLDVFGMWPDGTELKDYFSDRRAKVIGGKVNFGTTFGIVLAAEPLDIGTSVSLSINPASGRYPESITVEMTASTTAEGASTSIYYTTDGTTPSSNSIEYTAPFEVATSTTVNAIAYDTADSTPDEETRNYTIGVVEAFDVYFKKPADWSAAFVYLFNYETGDSLPGFPEWPGVNMTDSLEGTPWYKFIINYDVEVGIVFNDGGSKQTDDLTRSIDGWYVLGEGWSDSCPSDCPVEEVPVLSVSPDSGTYNGSVDVTMSATNSGAIYYTLDGSIPTVDSTPYKGNFTISAVGTTELNAIAINAVGSSEVTRTYTIESTPGFEVNFRKPDSWSTAYIYLFDKNTSAPIPGFPAWPGVSMEVLGSSPWYTYTVNESVEVGIVFNDNGGAQTDDLFRTTDGWYNGAWSDTCPGECPKESFDVYFKKPSSWSTAYIYLFDKNANASIPGFPAWPGVPMNSIQGSAWYVYTVDVDVDVVGIVFNDNGGAQTDDLERTADGWYDNQWSNNCPGDCPDPGALKNPLTNNDLGSEKVSLVKANPVPFGAYLTLSFANNLKDSYARIEMYDISGKRTAKTFVKNTGSNTVTLNTENLPKGMFLVKVISEDSIEILKVLK